MAEVYHNNIIDIDLESGTLFRSFLNHTIGSGDNNANWYGVRVFRKGEPIALSGCSVQGLFMPASGAAILISDGTHTWVSGNEAAVLLPQACYNVKGQFTLTIKIIGTNSYSITDTVRIIDGVVADTYSENPVAPTAAVPTYQEILAVYDQMVAAKDGSVRFDIEQELTAAQMTQARGNIAAASESDVSDLKSALQEFNAYNFFVPYPTDESTFNGITWSWSGETCSYSGSSTGTSFYRLFWIDRSHLPEYFVPGNQYPIRVQTTNDNVSLSFVFYKNGEILGDEIRFTSDGVISVPSDAQGVQIRVVVDSGKTVNGTIKAAVLSAQTNAYLSDTIVNLLQSGVLTGKGVIPATTDFNTLKSSGYYLVNGSSDYVYVHNPLPTGVSGHLIVYPTTANTILQVIVSTTLNKIFIRQSLLGSFSDNWTTIPDNNQYVYNNYENTYNITCNPSITTDTNNYLESTGDSTDMTGAIQTMLNTTGVCNLSPGDFYITGIDIPSNATLKGSGTKTRLILASSVTDGYAVKLKTYSCVKDMQILGQTAQYTPSATVGTRNGIIWQGSADASSNPTTYYRGTIENVIIANFNGSAIKCYNTGGNVATNLHATDAYVYWCDIGINIAYYSEFHRFTSVSVTGCYYGCIDNGGNCNFANCDFSGNTVGLLIDNNNDQSPNNSHGTFSACSFNHSGGNNGTAIRIMKATAGEIFTGCQIFFGAIEISGSVGIRFVGANVGRQVPITVTESAVVTFSDSTFYDGSSSPLTESNNTMLKFTDCYLRDGTVYNPVAENGL